MKYWRIWCKALGEKAGTTDRQSDGIAFIRTLLIMQHYKCFYCCKHTNRMV